jgi:hypothetical protein
MGQGRASPAQGAAAWESVEVSARAVGLAVPAGYRLLMHHAPCPQNTAAARIPVVTRRRLSMTPMDMHVKPPEVDHSGDALTILLRNLRGDLLFIQKPLEQLELMAQDEVSIAVNRVFSYHAFKFNLLLSDALEFHNKFSISIKRAAEAYQHTEAASAALLG